MDEQQRREQQRRLEAQQKAEREEKKRQEDEKRRREAAAAEAAAKRKAEEEAAAARLAAQAPPPIVNFEDEDGVDEPRAMQDASNDLRSFEFNKEDLLFYFNQIEGKMCAAGVRSNYTKFRVLSNIIPTFVTNEVKSLLRKQATDFPNRDAYKQLKTEILRIFAHRPEKQVEKALNRMLTGSPSQLLRALVGDLCKTELVGCQCCPAIIMALWKKQLPSSVRAGIAPISLSADTFKSLCELADDIFDNINLHKPTVAAASLDETQPAIPYAEPEVNAARNWRGRGRGRGGRGRGRGRGSQQQQQQQQTAAQGTKPKHTGNKHPDLPAGEWKGCSMHFRWGKGAHFCNEPATCPWKNVFTPKPANQ